MSGGTLPINNFSKVTLKSNTPTATSVSMAGNRQSKQLAAHYWSLDCDYRPLQRDEIAQIMAFLNKQRNSLSSFDIVIPQYSRPNGSIKSIHNDTNGAIGVSGTPGIGSTSVTVSFASLSQTAFTNAGLSTTVFKAGDFVKFNNHSKMYQLTDDVVISGTSATLNIFPGLFAPLTNGLSVIYWDVPFTVFNTQGTQEYNLSIGSSSLQLKLQEAL
jgi:hypothetical protein